MTQIKGLNANQLKLIAIIAMTIDHLVWTLVPGYSTEWWVILCHIIGRLTAPIMWYFIAEGYHYTRNVKNTPDGCSCLPSFPTSHTISASASPSSPS